MREGRQEQQLISCCITKPGASRSSRSMPSPKFSSCQNSAVAAVPSVDCPWSRPGTARRRLFKCSQPAGPIAGSLTCWRGWMRDLLISMMGHSWGACRPHGNSL